MIPDTFKQDLLHRVDIVDLIERYVRLKKSGANYSACCPFHTEKTPSFTVSPTKQFYHCFGCGANGNAISFLMEYQGLGYIEAVKELADLAGMKMPEFERRSEQGGAGRDQTGTDLHAVLQRAVQYYRDQLKLSAPAVDYLKSRGLTGRIAAHFGVGYAPAGWQNLQAIFPEYQDKSLKDCGLVIDGEGGRRYDRFRDRIMFPILNQRGSVIGFGGRVLGEGEPKYLNSPETALFEKGRELYGLPQARNAIRERGRAIVVEGYMDVVALAQHGIEYAVATLGTATSAVHLQKLFRQTDEIVFCFDGDAAGRRAAWHALEVSLPVLADHKSARFLFLPAEHDPDSYVRELGKEAFEQLLAAAAPLSQFFLSELSARVDMRTLEGRSRLIHEAKQHLKRIAAPALQLQLLKQIAEASGTTQEEAARLTDIRIYTGAASASRRNVEPAKGDPRGMHQARRRPYRALLRGLLVKPALADLVPIDALDSSVPEALVLADLVRSYREQASFDVDAILRGAATADQARIISDVRASLIDGSLEDENVEIEFHGAVSAVRAQRPNPRREALERKEREGGLSAEEYDEYRRLVGEDTALKQSRTAQPIVL